MSKLYNSKSIKLINSIVLALSIVACSTNQINSTSLNNDKSSISNKSNSFDLNKTFRVKYASGFNAMAYYLTYQDIRDSIKNKTIPDAFYHHYYTQVSEASRLTNPTYLQVKNNLESGDFSEEAYLIANPDVKSAVDAGTISTGYQHWYSYAQANESTRKTKQAYVDAKSAIDAGFNETAYRMRYPDIDNLVKTGALASAYIHYNTWAKNNEPTKLTDTRYVKIKNAILEGYDENAYLLAYPDVKTQVDSGFFPKGIDHYINYGLNEGRLERDIYQDAKLAIVNDFSETRYRNAYPDVLNGINLFWFPSAFEHFRRYGRYEGRITRPEYLNAKYIKSGSEFLVNTYTTNNQSIQSIAKTSNGGFIITWQSQNQVSSNNSFDIYAQRFNSNGVAQGSEFRVNTYTTNAQANSSIATDSNGNFIITWQSLNQSSATSDYDIYAQRYNSAGVAQGSEFRVNTYTTSSQSFPSVATDPNGNFIITWVSQYQVSGSSFNDIYAKRYNSSGIEQTSEFLVNSYTTNNQTFPSIATNSNGEFVIIWQSQNQASSSSSNDIYAQRFNSSGVAQGSEFRVNNYTTNIQRQPSIVTDSNGNFIITWHSNNQASIFSNYDIYAQRYSSQ